MTPDMCLEASRPGRNAKRQSASHVHALSSVKYFPVIVLVVTTVRGAADTQAAVTEVNQNMSKG